MSIHEIQSCATRMPSSSYIIGDKSAFFHARQDIVPRRSFNVSDFRKWRIFLGANGQRSWTNRSFKKSCSSCWHNSGADATSIPKPPGSQKLNLISIQFSIETDLPGKRSKLEKRGKNASWRTTRTFCKPEETQQIGCPHRPNRLETRVIDPSQIKACA